jgi:hypothetical protein
VNQHEAKNLIGYISAGLDNRAISDVTAKIWSDLMPDIRVEDALAAVQAHILRPAPRPYLDVALIIEGVRRITRQTPEAIEADVRSARARGLVGPEHSLRDPLPPAVAARLRDARAEFAREAAEIERKALAGADGVPVDVTGIGRQVPRE